MNIKLLNKYIKVYTGLVYIDIHGYRFIYKYVR